MSWGCGSWEKGGVGATSGMTSTIGKSAAFASKLGSAGTERRKRVPTRRASKNNRQRSLD